MTAFTVMLFAVGEPLTVGAALMGRPSPFAIVIGAIATDRTIGAEAPVTLAAGIFVGNVSAAAVALAAVGVPVMLMVTTVPLVRCAVLADNPAGKPATVKLAAVMLAAYVPPVSVYTTDAPLTACPTLRLPRPVADTSIAAPAAVVIAALRTAAPAS